MCVCCSKNVFFLYMKEHFFLMCYSKLSPFNAKQPFDWIISYLLLIRSQQSFLLLFLHAMCLFFNFNGFKYFCSVFSHLVMMWLPLLFCSPHLRFIGLLMISCYYVNFRKFLAAISSNIFPALTSPHLWDFRLILCCSFSVLSFWV